MAETNSVRLESFTAPAEPTPVEPQAQRSIGYVNRIAGNVKGSDFDIQLTQLVAIVGRQRSGKSRLAQAVQLGLTGEHDGSDKPKDLAELAPPNAQKLHLELWTSNGGYSMVDIEDVESRSPKYVVPFDFTLGGVSIPAERRKRMLPAVSLAKLVGFVESGARKAREAIFARWADVKEVPEPPELSPDQLAVWRQAKLGALAEILKIDPEKVTRGISDNAPDRDSRVARVMAEAVQAKLNNLKADESPPDPAETLTGMASWFRKHQRRHSIKASETAALISELSNVSGQGAEIVPDLKRKLDVAKAWEATEIARQQLAQARNEALAVDGEIRTSTAIFHQAMGHFDQVRVWSEGVEKQAHSLNQTKIQTEAPIAAILKTIAAHTCFNERHELNIQHGGTTCPGCGAPYDPRARLPWAQGRVQELKGQTQAAEQQIAVIEKQARSLLAEAQGHLNQASMARAQAKGRLDQATQQYGAILDRIKALEASVAAVAGHDGTSSAAIQAQIDSLELAARQEKQRNDLVGRRVIHEAQSEICKRLGKIAQTTLKEILESVRGRAEADMNANMPRGFKAILEIGDSTTRWVTLGTDDRTHKKGEACGSEYGALLLAMPLAWSDGASDRFVHLNEEVLSAFSPEGVWDVLTRFAELQQQGKITQVIVVWSRRAEIPPMYKIIDAEALAKPMGVGQPQLPFLTGGNAGNAGFGTAMAGTPPPEASTQDPSVPRFV